jgi:hypothetical protein
MIVKMQFRLGILVLSMALVWPAASADAQGRTREWEKSPPKTSARGESQLAISEPGPVVMLSQTQAAAPIEGQANPTNRPALSVGSLRRLSEVPLATAPPAGIMPTGVAEAPELSGRVGEMSQTRRWADVDYTWEASNLSHRPLYFEDVNAERYGNSALPALQPVFTSARFLATVPLLPYKMALDLPYEQDYVLGYYRPGDRAPNLGYRPPLRLKPFLMQGVVVGGVIAVFP